MSKYPTIKSHLKIILAFVAATMMCAVLYAFPASAALSTDWNTYNTPGGGVSSTMTIYIDDNSTGTVEVSNGATLTVEGTASSSANSLGVSLGQDSKLIWKANFTGSGSISISQTGTGTEATFSDGSVNTSASPAVTLGAGLTSVTINGSSIKSSNGTAIETYATLLTVNSGTIEGGDNGDTLRDTAVYGIDIDAGTAVLNGGRITTVSTDEVNNQDSAIYVSGNGHIRIAGAEIHGGRMNGVHISSSYSTLTMTSGTVTGRDAIHALTALSVSLSGGNISANSYSTSSDTAVHISDVPTGIISGNVIIDGGNSTGVEIHDTFHPGTRIDFTMDGGTIKGKNALHLSVVGTANITGGIITATGSAPEAGVLIGCDPQSYIWGTEYTQTVTIGGNVDINGGDSGIHIVQCDESLLTIVNITGGTISGATGLVIDDFGMATTTITDGTISGTTGEGIKRNTGTLNIAPTVSVTVQGGGSALDTTPTVNTPYYYTSENYDGSGRIPFRASEIPFANSLLYKYVQFLVAAPIFPTAPAPVYTTPEIIYQPIPLINYPTTDGEREWIEVIATLNKSGTVNSVKTAEDVAAAHRTAEAQNIQKIKLIITNDGTGISKSAMAKVYKAAEGTPIYLTFDLYETGEEEESFGNVIFKLNDKTGQILTRIKLTSPRIETAERDVAKRFRTGVLGSFEFAQKYGWGETATVTLNPESLGIDIHNGQKVTAYTYNAKTKKWYKITGKAADDVVILATSQSGVITFTK
jgi:hypothetical protein